MSVQDYIMWGCSNNYSNMVGRGLGGVLRVRMKCSSWVNLGHKWVGKRWVGRDKVVGLKEQGD